MIVNIRCRYPALIQTADQLYDSAAKWLDGLSQLHADFASWWHMPRTAREAYIPFSDRQGSIRRIEDTDRKLLAEFPTAMPGRNNRLLLSNVSSSKDWSRSGKVSLVIVPASGDLRFEISAMGTLYDFPTEIVWSILKDLASHPGVHFAQTDIQQLVDGEILLYSVNRGVFPHRVFLGWMGFVDSIVTEADVPDAARLQRLKSGTLVLSTTMLDLADAMSVKQANKVEIGLAELGCLPVTGTGLT